MAPVCRRTEELHRSKDPGGVEATLVVATTTVLEAALAAFCRIQGVRIPLRLVPSEKSCLCVEFTATGSSTSTRLFFYGNAAPLH